MIQSPGLPVGYTGLDTFTKIGKQAGLEAGRDFPRKSLISSEIFARHHGFLCERKLFPVIGNDFLCNKLILCERKHLHVKLNS